MTDFIRSALWLGFFATILLAWWVMFSMARMSGVDIIGQPVGMNMMPMSSFGALFPMWAIMMAAMMLPSLVPTLRSYDDLIHSASGTQSGWLGVLLGYSFVWVVFAALISGLQVILLQMGVIDSLGIAGSPLFASALLIVTGLFQFTRIKEICHGVCHAPMHFFLGHWRTGFVGGAGMGLHLGAYCVACCWGFMMLGFVGGVMSLLWMGIATLFMVIEKLPQIGALVIRPMGAVLVAVGLIYAGLSIFGQI